MGNKSSKSANGASASPSDANASGKSASPTKEQTALQSPTASRNSKLFRVVLTGGPCGGKTTALDKITQHLKGHGFQVFAVAEAATLLYTGGLQYSSKFTESELVAMETAVMKTQMHLEDTYHQFAKATNQPTVIICDRGTMDNHAYVNDIVWKKLLEVLKVTTVELRENRYDSVLHLTTAAKGAESFYTKSNNAARRESIEEAREMDDKILKCWLGHPSVHVIENSPKGFEEKINVILEKVCKLVGIPAPKGKITRFSIEQPVPIQFPKDIKVEQFDVCRRYIFVSDKEVTNLQRRTPLIHDSSSDINSEKRARRAFQEIDISANGTIELKELRLLVRVLGLTWSDTQLQQAFSEIDSNKDGKIEFPEFFTWWKKTNSSSPSSPDLKPADSLHYLIRRDAQQTAFTLSSEIINPDGTNSTVSEHVERLSMREYSILENEYKAGTTARQVESFFLWNGKTFKVTELMQPQTLAWVDVDVDSANAENFPSFLKIGKQVQDDPEYKTRTHALQNSSKLSKSS